MSYVLVIYRYTVCYTTVLDAGKSSKVNTVLYRIETVHTVFPTLLFFRFRTTHLNTHTKEVATTEGTATRSSIPVQPGRLKHDLRDDVRHTNKQDCIEDIEGP